MLAEKLPWLDEYTLLGIPHTFEPYPDEPVYEILYRAAKKFKKNGLIQFNYKMTYPRVLEAVERLATALLHMGLKKGDRVATLLPTSIQFVIADYAISRAGLVHIPCSDLEPVPTLEHKFKEGKPLAMISLAAHSGMCASLMKNTSLQHLVLTKLDDYLDPMIDLQEYEDVSTPRGARWMSELINDTEVDLPGRDEMNIDVDNDIETLLFTGGTTGLPKGCMLTHRNIYANSIQSLYTTGHSAHVMKGAIAVLMALPFFHSYGHVIMHTMTLFGVDQLLVPQPRNTGAMIKMIKERKPVMQIGVPAQFMKLAGDELKDINMIGISGSAPLSPRTQSDFESKTGGGIMEGYGLSEMSPCTHLNTSMLLRLFGGERGLRTINFVLRLPGVTPMVNGFLRLQGTRMTGATTLKLFALLNRMSRKKANRSSREKKGTTGIPYPDTVIKIIDVDTGQKLTWADMLGGRTGELCLNGPQRMLGYWPHSGSGLDEEGYVRTSDVVRVDARGYFSIVDRTKDMIIVSGFKVYSREVDDILTAHPAIEEAATVGIPDPRREGSEKVVVFVKLNSASADGITGEHIREYLKENVAKYAVPKLVVMLDELPVTAVQKVDKKELRKMAENEFGKQASAANSSNRS